MKRARGFRAFCVPQNEWPLLAWAFDDKEAKGACYNKGDDFCGERREDGKYMGNRALIVTEKQDVGVYLHWHGSPQEVRALLAYCACMGYRPPERDDYGWAQFIKTAANFIDNGRRSEGTGIGVVCSREGRAFTPPEDNGMYVIRGWRVIHREGAWEEDGPCGGDELLQLMEDINDCQPSPIGTDELEDFARQWEWGAE